MKNYRLELVRKSFTSRGAKQWNNFSLNLRVETKLGVFKQGLNKWIVEHVPRFLP